MDFSHIWATLNNKTVNRYIYFGYALERQWWAPWPHRRKCSWFDSELILCTVFPWILSRQHTGKLILNRILRGVWVCVVVVSAIQPVLGQTSLQSAQIGFSRVKLYPGLKHLRQRHTSFITSTPESPTDHLVLQHLPYPRPQWQYN